MAHYTLHDNELRCFRFTCDSQPILTHSIPATADEFRALLRDLFASDLPSIAHAEMVLTQTEMAVSVTSRAGEILIPWQDAARIACAVATDA
ncbi:MAG: hypothetical protein JJ938_15370 [Roseicyclus sp.]|nr:hypothetical protein [Roseicyclus sp.]MBO6626259.1 hypothetical protein [Roseicyclus sp.]MBO6923944.1 hypothetical protein [Roseicyclus sp.]